MEQISRMDEMQEHNSIEYKNLVEELSAINRMTKLILSKGGGYVEEWGSRHKADKRIN